VFRPGHLLCIAGNIVYAGYNIFAFETTITSCFLLDGDLAGGMPCSQAYDRRLT